MAASGGGLVPSPPKRPTIIRPSNDAGHPVPARPAPPVPGPAVPSRPNVTDKVPSRPEPSPPSRPAEPTRPHPPLPSRPAEPPRPELPPPSRAQPPPSSRAQPPPLSKSAEVTKSLSFSGLLSKTLERPNSTEVKKRPEITIVSARPMSEIGFRDNKASAPANNPVEALSQTSKPSMSSDGTDTTGHPPAPAPRISPRVEKQINLDSTDSREPARGPPPRVPRHSLLLKNNKNEETDEIENKIKVLSPTVINEDNEKAKEITHRGPPPPVPRPTVIKPDISPLGGPHKQPPPVPGRPAVSLEEPELRLDCNESYHNSLPRPLGAPPPLPRSPSARNKLPSPVPHRSKNISQEDATKIHQAGDNKHSDSDSNKKPEKVEDVNDLYAVINKPKRPTIIRPGKPTEEKLKTETKTSEEIKPTISPRKIENNAESNSEDIDENPVPEFLRKKLKQTLDVESRSEANGVSPTAGSGRTIPLKPRPMSSRGPPPATKPKPSVLPKPQVAAKPVSTLKTNEDKHGDTEIENERTESDVKVISSQSGKPSGSLNDISEAVKQLKPAAVKRPTIIRPSRSAKYGSVENISQVSTTEKTKSDEMLKPFTDDSAIESKPRPVLPLPNRRPVSMINIHKAVEDDDNHISEILTTASSKSSENVSETLRPKPSPRPAARSRPVTMIEPPVSRPPLPNTGPRLAKSSGPSRPQGGPPIQTFTNDTEQDDMKHRSEKEMNNNKANKHVPLGVPVFPKVETDHSTPPKPVRRPPPPKSSPHKTSESSDDEEFVTAKDKPDRPPAGPARKASGSVPRDSGCEDHLKPPRPGAPPPPHKSSVTGSPDKDDGDEEPVKKRPSKPEGRPQRPMSMPVKQILPSKPQPPKPHAVKAGKKGLPPLPSRPKPGHPLYFHMMQVAHGIALHDYTAQHDDELSFKTGDLIVLERRVDADWIMGKVNEQEGMFPKDFVKVKMPLPGEKLDDDDSSNDSAEIYYDASAEKPDNIGHGPRCRARFDFDGEGPDDLIFEEGDVIRLIDRVGLEWRKGEINGRTGLFPLNFVEIIEDLPEGESDTGNVVKAIFDFEGEEGDLNFQAGESIKVTHVVNEEWLFGEIGNKKGQFPVQFVDHVPHGLPFLSGDTAKGDQSEVVDKHTASLGMWDNHDDHVQKMNTSAVPSDELRNSEDHVSMVTSRGITPYCVAAYDYPPQTDEDLGFRAGDYIELVERISADWLKGKLGDKIGMFPASFVDVKVDIDTTADHISEPPNSKMGEKFGVALYEFIGEAENELTFKAGDRFEVQDLVEGAEDWRWGIIDGRRGMFPAAFVEINTTASVIIPQQWLNVDCKKHCCKRYNPIKMAICQQCPAKPCTNCDNWHCGLIGKEGRCCSCPGNPTLDNME